jgi:hypothetical protein
MKDQRGTQKGKDDNEHIIDENAKSEQHGRPKSSLDGSLNEREKCRAEPKQEGK